MLDTHGRTLAAMLDDLCHEPLGQDTSVLSLKFTSLLLVRAELVVRANGSLRVPSAAGAADGSQGQVRAQRARRPWTANSHQLSTESATELLGFSGALAELALFPNQTRGYALRARPWLPSAAPAAL